MSKLKICGDHLAEWIEQSYFSREHAHDSGMLAKLGDTVTLVSENDCTYGEHER